MMDKSSEQLAAHIESTRRELGNNLEELEGKVKDATNWRVQFQRHPMMLIGVAFAGGVLLSAIFGRRSHRAGRAVPQVIVYPGPSTREKEANLSASANVWRDIKGAVGSAVGSQVYSVLGDFIPGLEEQAAKRARETGQSKVRAGRSVNGGPEQTASPTLPPE